MIKFDPHQYVFLTNRSGRLPLYPVYPSYDLVAYVITTYVQEYSGSYSYALRYFGQRLLYSIAPPQIGEERGH